MSTSPCTHLPTSHEKPHTVVQFYDNLTLILEYIEGTFQTLHEAAEDSNNGVSLVADLGATLTVEAQARAKALYEHLQNDLTMKKEG